jgi:hypothetical protein
LFEYQMLIGPFACAAFELLAPPPLSPHAAVPLRVRAATAAINVRDFIVSPSGYAGSVGSKGCFGHGGPVREGVAGLGGRVDFGATAVREAGSVWALRTGWTRPDVQPYRCGPSVTGAGRPA